MTFFKYTRSSLEVFGVLFLLAGSASAVPTFQVYIEGAQATSVGADGSTWVTCQSPLTLVAVGAFNNTESLQFGTLVISVSQGAVGAITVSGAATLLTTRATPFGNNPNGDANVNRLTNVPGNDAYGTKEALPVPFANEFPFQSDVSDFLLYDLGSFAPVAPVKDFNAGTGTITQTSQPGEEKLFTVSVSGFSRAHFDLYGFEVKTQGAGAWEINPGSHDSSFYAVCPFIPAPGTLLLSALGAGLVSRLRTRRML